MSSIFNLGDQIKLAFSNAMLELELSDTGRALSKSLSPAESIDCDDDGASIEEPAVRPRRKPGKAETGDE